MKILITGGCGFIGTNLSLFLKKKGYNVFTLDNFQRKGSKSNYKILHKKKSQFNKIISNASPKEPIQLRPKKTIQPLFKTNNKDN